MYLASITLVKTLPCLAEPGKIIVIGKPNRSLDSVIPYLATLPGIIAYNPHTLTLTFRRPAGFMALYPDQIYITQVKDSDEGLELLEALKDAVNAVWDKRDELTAITQERKAPKPLDVWSLLPRTNCRQCGEATCMAFAVGVIQQKRQVEECPPLKDDPAFSERLAALQGLV
ncbi:MAG: (Fe-S)-binding protein [Chloroflexota bacterium]